MKPAVLIVCALVALAFVGAIGYYGYHKYKNHVAYAQARVDALQVQETVKTVLGGHFPTEPGSKDVPMDDGHVVISWTQKPVSDLDSAMGTAWLIHCERFHNGNATPEVFELTLRPKHPSSGVAPAQ